MRPAIDRAAGPARAGGAGGGRHRSASTPSGTSLAQVAVDRTIRPFKDPEFSREQADEDPRAGRPAHQGAAAAGLRGDDAGGDQRGRVDALRPRGDHGVRRWSPPPADLRSGWAERWTNVCEQVPGIARIAAGAAWRSTLWTAGAARRTGRLVLRTVTDPEASAELLEEVARDVGRGGPDGVHGGPPDPGGYADRDGARGGRAGPRGHPATWWSPASGSHHAEPGRGRTRRTSRARGARLLERSRDVWSDEDDPPGVRADPRRPRARRGAGPDAAASSPVPQPSVDVRTGGPVGMVSSQLIAPGLTMIGAARRRALPRPGARPTSTTWTGSGWSGCRREPLTDPMEYQVLEAQPDVLAAMHSVKFAKVVRRSIHLTPFGEDFCRDLPARARARPRSCRSTRCRRSHDRGSCG